MPTTNIDPYFIYDQDRPFATYLELTRALIQRERVDLTNHAVQAQVILNANCPFELNPAQATGTQKKFKYGALMVHGLFDSSFTMRDIATHLHQEQILCRSLLLPGHGTRPDNLLAIHYNDWVQAVKYGVHSMQQMVEHLYLIGYSTGGALAIYHALHDEQNKKNEKIAGLVLIAPAIQITTPINLAVASHHWFKHLLAEKKWLYRQAEVDYVKYLSVAVNPVLQVSALTKVLGNLANNRSLRCPMLLILSDKDEVVRTDSTLAFFSATHHPRSEVLLYSSTQPSFHDARISLRTSHFPELNVRHFSHLSLPFAPHNPHYGQHGDYCRSARINNRESVYGAYNPVEVQFFTWLNKFNLATHCRENLTYNPDFAYMVERMKEFILWK